MSNDSATAAGMNGKNMVCLLMTGAVLGSVVTMLVNRFVTAKHVEELAWERAWEASSAPMTLEAFMKSPDMFIRKHETHGESASNG